jgi:hypothetical protein
VFQPSPEQQLFFDFVRAERRSAILSSVAGSGKSTTILHSLEHLDAARPLILSFNKSVADHMTAELRAMGRGEEARTFHSLGFAEEGGALRAFVAGAGDAAAAQAFDLRWRIAHPDQVMAPPFEVATSTARERAFAALRRAWPLWWGWDMPVLRRQIRATFELGTAGVEEPAEGLQPVRLGRIMFGLDAQLHQAMEDTSGVIGHFLIAQVRKPAACLVLDDQRHHVRPHGQQAGLVAHQPFQHREKITVWHGRSAYALCLGMVRCRRAPRRRACPRRRWLRSASARTLAKRAAADAPAVRLANTR